MPVSKYIVLFQEGRQDLLGTFCDRKICRMEWLIAIQIKEDGCTMQGRVFLIQFLLTMFTIKATATLTQTLFKKQHCGMQKHSLDPLTCKSSLLKLVFIIKTSLAVLRVSSSYSLK